MRVMVTEIAWAMTTTALGLVTALQRRLVRVDRRAREACHRATQRAFWTAQ